MNLKNKFALLGILLLSGETLCAQQQLPLSLAECRERALTHSEELQQADNRLEQARLDRKIALTASLPKIEGSLMGVYVLPDMDMMGMEMRIQGAYMAGLNLTQPIYAGGKIAAAQHMARIGEESAEQQRRMTRMDVLVEADRAYWTLVAVERKVRMLESYAQQMDTLWRQTSAALEAGMAIDNDLLRIEAKGSEIRYQLQKARNGADLCRMSLCRVIGVESDVCPVPTDTLFQATAPGELQANLEARPEAEPARTAGRCGRAADPRCSFGDASHGRVVAGLYVLRKYQASGAWSMWAMETQSPIRRSFAMDWG